MKYISRIASLSIYLLFIVISHPTIAQKSNPLEGRWDLEISKDGQVLPSWLEIRHSGNNTLVGRFVYAFGSARPIAEVKPKDGKFTFSIPPQWEQGDNNMEFEGEIKGGKLTGTMKYTDGKIYEWTGIRAPQLPFTSNPQWDEPINLFNGFDLKGWHATGKNQWVVERGVLKSPASGANLVSDEKFMDFKLHAEFRYQENGNSGIYLRGRYEVQIADNKGLYPSDILFGGIYGFLTPNAMVAKDPGQWQSYDITLIGNRVSVIANGIPIITDQIIPGITGGALDSKEATPGPIQLQGDHGPIEFRNIIITPLLKN